MEQLLEILYSLDRRSRNVIIEALDPDVVDYIIYEEEAAAEEAKPSLRDRASALAQNVRGRLPEADSYAGQAGIGAGVGAGVGAAGAAIHWAAKRRALSKKLKACTTDECKQQVKSQISALKKSALKRGLAATALGAAGGAGVGLAKKGVEGTDFYQKNISHRLPYFMLSPSGRKVRRAEKG